MQAKLSASQYGFRAGVATKTALHEFVRRVEHCLVWKKPPLGIFLDIVGAFDNVTFRSFVAALRGLGMSKIFTSWIETLLRHRTVQVELCGDKVKREVVKRNPQSGILSSFLWNCVLNSLLLELRSRGFYVQAYADNLAVLVTGADMLWIRGMAQKARNIAENCALEQELQFSCKKTEIVLHNQSFVALVDSQAAIKALIKCTVTSITVLNCIRNLNQLGKQNHVSIAWIPGHAGVSW